MGFLFGSKPPSVPVPPPAAAPPVMASSEVKVAGADQRQKAAAAITQSDTVGKSGPQGALTKPQTASQTLLG